MSNQVVTVHDEFQRGYSDGVCSVHQSEETPYQQGYRSGRSNEMRNRNNGSNRGRGRGRGQHQGNRGRGRGQHQGNRGGVVATSNDTVASTVVPVVPVIEQPF